MKNFSVNFLYFIVIILFSAFENVAAQAFSDNFSQNSLANTGVYVESFPGFRVQGGLLQGRAMPLEQPQLNILPGWGRRATFRTKARWTSGDKATVVVFADYLYRTTSPHIRVYFSFHRNQVGFQPCVRNGDCNSYEEFPYQFEKGKWFDLALEKKDGKITALVNGTPIKTVALPSKSDTDHADPAESEYGGFALGVNSDDVARVVDFDDLSIQGDPSPVPFRSVVVPFMMAQTQYRFSVIYETGYEIWGAKQAEISVPYLKWLSELYGRTPAIHTRLGMVQARGSWHQGYKGYNAWGWSIWQGSKDKPDFMNCHELAHNWQHLFGNRWSVEGSANFACNLYHRERQPHQILQARWYGESPIRLAREGNEGLYFPLSDDAVFNASDFNYEKGALFIQVLYRLLGRDGFKSFHRELYAKRNVRSRGLMRIVERISGTEMKDIFAGWVFPGQGKYDAAGASRDSDSDGFSDLDEALFGTDARRLDTDGDGYGDAAEIRAGFNPANRSEPRNIILTDGLTGDWSGQGVEVSDPDDGKTDGDIKSVRSVVDQANGWLHIRIDTHRPFLRTPGDIKDSYVSLDFSRNGKDIDYRSNVFYHQAFIGFWDTRGNFTYGGVWKPEGWKVLDSGRIQSAVGIVGSGAVIEISIPMDMFEVSNLKIFVTTGTPSGSDGLEAGPVAPTAIQGATRMPVGAWFPPGLHGTFQPDESIGVSLVSKKSGKCADVYAASEKPGAIVLQWNCHGGDNQLWRMEERSGRVRFVSVNSDLCLEVKDSSTEDMAPVIQMPCSESKSQWWRLRTVEGEYRNIVSEISGKCLDTTHGSMDDGAGLIQYACHGEDNMKWSVVQDARSLSVRTRSLGDGPMEFRNDLLK